ncbi:MAG: DNA methyltransferase, partial [Flavobacteriales bacterium]
AVKNNEKLPKEDIYKLFSDEEDVFLFWNGRNEEVTNAALPFHSIEHIDEPRKEIEDGQVGMFDLKGRQLKGWTNKLIWGDNKLILSSLANGPIREQIEEQGGLKLIYIDPPFAVGSDFSHDIEVHGETATKKQSVLEEIAYRDTWGKGISSYLNMMYERLKLMYQLLADDGSIYVHCDYRMNSYLRLMLDDIFGTDNFKNLITWKRTDAHNNSRIRYGIVTDSIIFYTKSDSHIFNYNNIRGELSTSALREYSLILKEDGVVESYIEGKEGRRFKLNDATLPSNNPNKRFEWRGAKPPNGRSWPRDIQGMEEGLKDMTFYLRNPNKGAARCKVSF